MAPPPSPPEMETVSEDPSYERQQLDQGKLPWNDEAAVDQSAPPEQEQPHYPAPGGGGHAVSTQVGGDVIALAENYGFKGLDLTAFGVLPIIVLKDEVFQVNDGSIRFGEEFYCLVYGADPKFVYKTDLGERDPRNDLFYTYDDQFISGSGNTVQSRLAEWKKQGLPYLRKDYIDIRVGVLREGYDEPLLAILSVPPTSKANYTNIALQLVNWAKSVAGNPADRMVRVFKGPKVTKVKHPFCPIKFELMPQ